MRASIPSTAAHVNVRCAWHGPLPMILAYVGPAYPWSDGICEACAARVKAEARAEWLAERPGLEAA